MNEHVRVAGPLWLPASLEQVIELFGDASFRWWMSGGIALELHVGRSWRGHDDTDIGVTRIDMSMLRALLPSWQMCIASGGSLRVWRGEPLRLDRSENNVWCRRRKSEPWAIDITISEGNEREWVFRRDDTIALPWSEAVQRSAAGVPYLAPEIQLLFKSRDRRPKDDVDAQVVIPLLDEHRASRLRTWLPHDHAWRALVRPSA
jgi:hypothetical protein